jgi:hypothetical protein
MKDSADSLNRRLFRGALPRTRPSLGEGGRRRGQLLARAGRALPRNLRSGKGSLRSARGQTLAAPENPG